MQKWSKTFYRDGSSTKKRDCSCLSMNFRLSNETISKNGTLFNSSGILLTDSNRYGWAFFGYGRVQDIPPASKAAIDLEKMVRRMELSRKIEIPEGYNDDLM